VEDEINLSSPPSFIGPLSITTVENIRTAGKCLTRLWPEAELAAQDVRTDGT